MAINLLSPQIFNRIAAGEVVEKPASVVKELVENSLDAGATKIKMEIAEGGIKKICVSDNGCGIEKDDLPLAFLPHATSKICSLEDLDGIATLGFRGEALASIASVAFVELSTKTAKQEIGYKICANGGEISAVSEIARLDGTTICVQNLFYNTPVRAKFLKKPKVEEGEVTHLIEKFILSHPEVEFSYYVDGKQIYNHTSHALKDAIYLIYGREVYDNLLEISAEEDGICVSGFVASPKLSRPNRTYQSLFVNGRYVENYMISACVGGAFEPFLMKGRFPIYVIKLDLPFDRVDVNIHPNKREVKFENTSQIFGIVRRAVENALVGANLIAEHQFFVPEKKIWQGFADDEKANSAGGNANFADGNSSLAGERAADRNANLADKAGLDAQNLGTQNMGALNFDALDKNANPDAEPARTDFNAFGVGGRNVDKLSATEGASYKKTVDLADEKIVSAKEYQKQGIEIFDMPDFSGVKGDERRVNKPGGTIFFDHNQDGLLHEVEISVARDMQQENALNGKDFGAQGENFENSAFSNGANRAFANGTFTNANSANANFSRGNFVEEKFLQADASEIKVLGVVFKTYIITEFDDSIYVIDQHAMHERQNYDALRAQVEKGNVLRQTLLVPFETQLLAADAQVFAQKLPALQKIGFDISLSGNNLRISAVPMVLCGLQLQAFLDEVLSDREIGSASALINEKLCQTACKHSIRAGDSVSKDEILYLIGKMKDGVALCPHGRPIVVKITRRELEKMFKRVL